MSSAPKKAATKPETINPLTKKDTSQKSKPLITKVKSPKVRTFTGRVRISKSGRIKIFKIARTKATTTAVVKSATSIPGIKE